VDIKEPLLSSNMGVRDVFAASYWCKKTNLMTADEMRSTKAVPGAADVERYNEALWRRF
jgi:hypothetical protein